MKTSTIEVRDMLSVFSVDEVEKRIGEVPGVESVTVNFAAGNAPVRYDETRLDNADIKSAVLRRAAKLTVVAPTGFKSIDGQGAQAQTAEGMVFLGNRLLIDTQKLALGPLEADAARLQGEGRTVVHVAQNGTVIGLIAIADAIRPTAKAAVAKLCERGIEVVMLTGDNAGTAKRIAADLGITSVLSDV